MTREERKILKSQVWTLISMSKSDETLVFSDEFQECLDKTENLLARIASAESDRSYERINGAPTWQNTSEFQPILRYLQERWWDLENLELCFVQSVMCQSYEPHEHQKQALSEIVKNLRNRPRGKH